MHRGGSILRLPQTIETSELQEAIDRNSLKLSDYPCRNAGNVGAPHTIVLAKKGTSMGSACIRLDSIFHFHSFFPICFFFFLCSCTLLLFSCWVITPMDRYRTLPIHVRWEPMFLQAKFVKFCSFVWDGSYRTNPITARREEVGSLVAGSMRKKDLTSVQLKSTDMSPRTLTKTAGIFPCYLVISESSSAALSTGAWH